MSAVSSTVGKGQKASKAAKEVVIGFRQRNGELRYFHAMDVKSGTLAKYIQENISTDVEIHHNRRPSRPTQKRLEM